MLAKESANACYRHTSQLPLSDLTCLTSLTDVLAFCTPFSDMLALCHGGPTVLHSVPGRKTLQSQCSWLI